MSWVGLGGHANRLSGVTERRHTTRKEFRRHEMHDGQLFVQPPSRFEIPSGKMHFFRHRGHAEVILVT